MGKLLRHRRLGRGRADRIAVRGDGARRGEAAVARGRGRRRVCDADDRPLQLRAAVVGAGARSAAVLWGLVGLGGFAYSVIVARRVRRQGSYQPGFEDWLCHAAVPLAAYAALVLSALMAPSRAGDVLLGI